MRGLAFGVAFWIVLPCGAWAQAEGGSGQGVVALPEVVVIGTTPVGPAGTDRDKVPFNTHVLTSQDVSRTGYPSALRSLEDQIGGVTLNNAQNNPFQPNLLYRGFEASPLGGNAQGLAVYLNGVRFNQAFGDTVNWDLIPDLAIDRITLEGANPAFGLNALGGSLAVQLKNGFTYQGTELQTLGGSFGRFSQSFQHGRQIDNVGLYIAGTGLSENGWREHSPSRLRQFYGDLGWKGDRGEFHINVIGASNTLVGNGTSPVELLRASRRAAFTYPDRTENDFGRVTLSGAYEFSNNLSFQGNLYYGKFRQKTANGDAADVGACGDDGSILCLNDGPALLDLKGNPVRNSQMNTLFSRLPAFAGRFDDGGPYTQLNETSTETDSFGGSLQATYKGDLFGRPSRLVIGGSIDHGDTKFRASSQIGAMTLDRGFGGPGTVFQTPDGTIAPVHVDTTNTYGGIFFSNALDVTNALTLTLAGRYNVARIELRDQIGTELNGDHDYSRFNPAIGLSYKIMPNVTLYGGYSEANRAPTPAELSCADPASPCSLTNFFVGDPHLKQVVARTLEAGLRGTFTGAASDFSLGWKVGVFHTNSADDIMFVSSEIPGRAYFQNVGRTRRQGVEAGLSFVAGQWSGFIEYALTDATFRKPLVLNSPENPYAVPNPAEPDNDDAGVIFVHKGNRLPGIPRHMVKIGLNYQVTDNWKIGLTARAASGKYLYGDESNLNPKTAAYAVIGLNTSWQVTKNIQIFGLVENALNAKYATFGTFSPTSLVPILQVPGATNPRSLSAGPPIAAYGGVKITF